MYMCVCVCVCVCVITTKNVESLQCYMHSNAEILQYFNKLIRITIKTGERNSIVS